MAQRLAVLLLVIAPVCGANSKYAETKTQTWAFRAGGRVELRLRGGDVHVSPSRDSAHLTIRYTMESDHPAFARRVKAEFEVGASEADLRFRAPIDGSVNIDLEVPVQTNVYVRAKGGDLSVQGIEGDQDLQTIGGDIALDLPAELRFYRVDASTHFGDIDNSPFGDPKGWLGKRIHFRGDGKYRLHAHTFAGDIHFSPLSASR
ncbi:MAG TPA: hypothetical protein VEJ67_13430 [Candidatus Cybelea sp.]|nr:hypothetical protein [Candidatus Cybelea sp.]